MALIFEIVVLVCGEGFLIWFLVALIRETSGKKSNMVYRSPESEIRS
ncbi:MAG: hypothetical protein M3P27_10015 [Acidobacteriota bacterium]|nr:hypothetical protein [Acidobacteriota bacterium]